MLVAVFLGLVLLFAALVFAIHRLSGIAERKEEERAQAVQDRRRILDFMHLMAEALGEGLSRQELLQRIVHASILCTGALSACAFERTLRNTLRGAALEGLFPPLRPLPASLKESLPTRARFIEQIYKGEEFSPGEGIVGQVAGTGRGELIADASRDPRIARHDDPALGIRSLIAVPMAFRSRFFGVLVVANPVEERPFTEMDFSLLLTLADQASLALHNLEFLNLEIEKRQMDLDLSIASGIQQMLLPGRSAAIYGLDIEALYTPSQQVGGDLYDILCLPDGRLGVAVGDVSGKGVSASLLMAICRTNLRQIAPRHSTPSAALAELNRALSVDMQGGRFVTMLYAVIDPARSLVTFARAGHELPLFVRREAVGGAVSTAFPRSEGMALGMVPDEVFSGVIADHSEPFGPGDVLVLYTDGVTEAPNEEEKEFSGARLADAVRDLHGRPAREINEGIIERVQRFAGDAAQRDDLTLVTVRRA